MNKKKFMTFFLYCLSCMILVLMVFSLKTAFTYPIDGYDQSGIRRLKQLELIMSGKIQGLKPPLGALLSTDQIRLHLESRPLDLSDSQPFVDASLQKKIEGLFPNRDESYSVAVLDISPDRPVRLALRQAKRRFPIGSVGKLAIAAGLFNELQHLYPDEPEKRQALLKNRTVTAGSWIETDHHNIPIFSLDSNQFSYRPAQQGDQFSLYEWADHMISASANAAASTVWKEAILMRQFGAAYPPPRDVEKKFFETTPKSQLSSLAAAVVNDPLLRAGISREDFHLGSFFTAQGKKMIPGVGDSQASPLGLLKYLVAMEQGRIVDPWSSLEIKRLMYSTARRIRYASSPALTKSAVYFKSGSLYKCGPEPGFTCKKYMGNKENIMNSVAIVEHPDSRIYLVALMTNVLKKNSAVDHQGLATEIEAILRQ